MSTGHPTEGPRNGQPEIDDSEARRSFRLSMGIATRRDLAWGCEVSLKTVELWEAAGLPMFRPGTGSKIVRLTDFAEFMAQRPELKGRRKKKGRSK